MRELLDLGYLRSVLDYDPETGIFIWKISPHHTVEVGSVAGGTNQRGYRRHKIKNKHFIAHRLAWFYVYGVWPKNELDHINGNKEDNRIANLREATRSQNQNNMPKKRNNTSGYKGVSWHKVNKKWIAQTEVKGRAHFFGYYSTPEDAHVAYVNGIKKLHGEFAHT